jgi:hypothetical protein
MTSKTIFLVIIIGFTACEKPFTPKDLEKTWAINDIEFKDKDINQMNKSTGDLYKNFIGKFHLKLDENGNSISKSSEGGLELEQWKYNDSSKLLTLYSPNHADVVKYKIVKASANELRLEHISEVAALNQIWIMKPDTLYAGNSVDLMSYKANEWRIPPVQKENDQQIQLRVKSLISYLEGYFSLVVYKKQNSFNTQMANEPFLYYRNGLSLMPETDLPKEYIAYFYDKEDALKGYKMIEKLFLRMEYPSGNATFSEGYAKCFRIMKAML